MSNAAYNYDNELSRISNASSPSLPSSPSPPSPSSSSMHVYNAMISSASKLPIHHIIPTSYSQRPIRSRHSITNTNSNTNSNTTAISCDSDNITNQFPESLSSMLQRRTLTYYSDSLCKKNIIDIDYTSKQHDLYYWKEYVVAKFGILSI